MHPRQGFIPPHGGYEKLKSYQKTLIVYDGTVLFCRRFLTNDRRTTDQMVQAARSGKQNIVEGSQDSGTSKEIEIKLLGVARGSLEELLEDYRDFIRNNGGQLWDKSGAEALYVRRLGATGTDTFETYKPFFETRPATVYANIMVCLIHQANYLTDRLMRALEKSFVAEGGLRERMTRARKMVREK